MDSKFQEFSFNETEIRVVSGENGEPWFVAKDIAEVLGYENTAEAIRDHCKNVILMSGSEMLGASDYNAARALGYSHNDAVRQYQIIPERDVYRLIMRSKLPSAEKFEEWVVSEVLPSIRKHGAYMTPSTIDDLVANPDLLIQLATKLKFEQQQRVLMEQQRDEALRTKAWIGNRREATAMATASIEKRRAEVLAQKNDKLAEQVGESTTWKTVKSVKWISAYFIPSPGMWSAVGKRLTALSRELGFEIHQVEHSDYGTVNAYHVEVIARFRAKLDADLNMMQKYRDRRISLVVD